MPNPGVPWKPRDPRKIGFWTPENGKIPEKVPFPCLYPCFTLRAIFPKKRGGKEVPQKCHIARKIGFFRGNRALGPIFGPPGLGTRISPWTPVSGSGRPRDPETGVLESIFGPRNRGWGQKIAQTPYFSIEMGPPPGNWVPGPENGKNRPPNRVSGPSEMAIFRFRTP